MATYSNSKISTFEQCRQKYKFQYIDRIKVDVPTTIEAFMGDIVHQTLHKLYEDLKFQKKNSIEELHEFFDGIWDENWDENILIVKDYSANHYKSMGKTFIEDYYTRYEPFNHSKTIGLETQDLLDLNGKDKYHVRIDRLACDSSGNYYICDYKTNSRLKTQEDLDEDRQLAMYSLWVKQKFRDAKSVKLVWYFLAFDKEMVSERSEAQLKNLQKQVEEKIRQIKRTSDFPPNVTKLCDYCVYKGICPAFTHKYTLDKLKEEGSKEDDDGASLVDEYANIKSNLSSLKAKEEEVKEKLINYARKNGLSAVFSENATVTVKENDDIRLPEKKEREEIIQALEKHSLLGSFSTLDTIKLKKAILTGELPQDVIEDIGEMIEYHKSYRLSISKNKK